VSYQVLQCPVCGSQELSPKTDYSSFETHARFTGMGGAGLLGGAKDLTMGASRARVCLDCGHLILFVSDSDRRRLRTAVGE
jgi:DNA-directed RNA polymerase subunit RPC12/RpoP